MGGGGGGEGTGWWSVWNSLLCPQIYTLYILIVGMVVWIDFQDKVDVPGSVSLEVTKTKKLTLILERRFFSRKKPKLARLSHISCTFFKLDKVFITRVVVTWPTAHKQYFHYLQFLKTPVRAGFHAEMPADHVHVSQLS